MLCPGVIHNWLTLGVTQAFKSYTQVFPKFGKGGLHWFLFFYGSSGISIISRLDPLEHPKDL